MLMITASMTETIITEAITLKIQVEAGHVNMIKHIAIIASKNDIICIITSIFLFIRSDIFTLEKSVFLGKKENTQTP